MREASFVVITRPDGSLIGTCEGLRLVVSAMDRVELQEEARDALIAALGPAHVSYRVRLVPMPAQAPAPAPLSC